jgi:hypothetical protein
LIVIVPVAFHLTSLFFFSTAIPQVTVKGDDLVLNKWDWKRLVR